MLVNKAYKFRIYPNRFQEILIAKTFGSCRYLFNHFLVQWNENYKQTGKGLTYGKCSAQLPALKNELVWLKEVDSTALQSSLRNLVDGFTRFFHHQKDAPHFKSKNNKVQSYTTKYTNDNIRIIGNKIRLPKLGLIRFAKSREVEGRIIQATVRRNPSGKYFVSILTETEVEELPKTESIIGVDLGLKDLAVLSNGNLIRKSQISSQTRTKVSGSAADFKPEETGSNWHKAKIKVARMHESIANARNNYLHKISTKFIKSHDVIGIEDLKVSNMMRNHKLAKSISEVSWYRFRKMLEYKAKWYGKLVIAIPSNYPSSQLYSCCGIRYKNIKDLSVRERNCDFCGTHHDRDINAAQNIRYAAIRILTVGETGIA